MKPVEKTETSRWWFPTIYPPWKFNRSPLKIGLPNRKLHLPTIIFAGAMFNFGRVTFWIIVLNRHFFTRPSNIKLGWLCGKFPFPCVVWGPSLGIQPIRERSKTVLDFTQFGSTTGGPLHLVGWVIEGIMLPNYTRNTISQHKDPYKPISTVLSLSRKLIWTLHILSSQQVVADHGFGCKNLGRIIDGPQCNLEILSLKLIKNESSLPSSLPCRSLTGRPWKVTIPKGK